MLLGVAASAVIYLATANAMLRTRWLRDVVNRSKGIEVEYASAYSVWPGSVHLRGLELEVQSHTVELSIGAESGLVQVGLHDLLFRRFHATSVALTGLSVRFRNRVHPSEANSARVAAYPPIRGLSDPPLLEGEKPPSTPDEAYDLWQVELEDVRAELRELWFFEYHYLGDGLARGGFTLQPARHFTVFPSSVSLERGELSVGRAVAAERLQADLKGSIDFTDLRQTSAHALLEKISARLGIDAHDIELGPLDSYAPRGKSPRIAGHADLRLAASVTRGHLDPQSSAELGVGDLFLSTPAGILSGTLTSSAKVLPEGRIDWVTSSRVRLHAQDSQPASERARTEISGRIHAELAPVAGREWKSTGRVDIELDGVEVERNREEQPKRFRAAIRMPDVVLSLKPEPTLSTSVDIYARPADSLLSLALGSPMLEDLAADVFDLGWLEARARVTVSDRAVRLELSRAESGELTGTGFWQKPAAGNANGAFLISSKVANVGISLLGSNTQTAWFVPDDWLRRARSLPGKGDPAKSPNPPAPRSAARTKAHAEAP